MLFYFCGTSRFDKLFYFCDRSSSKGLKARSSDFLFCGPCSLLFSGSLDLANRYANESLLVLTIQYAFRINLDELGNPG